MPSASSKVHSTEINTTEQKVKICYETECRTESFGKVRDTLVTSNYNMARRAQKAS